MASPIQRIPATPRQAARRRSDLDRRLDAEFFKALAEPTRVRLLACLIKCGRPCSVTEVAACCDIDFSMVARHLATLARAGVLHARKEGRTVWYEAPSDELAARFRDLAGAIDEWTGGGCADDACGCDPGDAR
jgi:ArsR family transcriptional regulator